MVEMVEMVEMVGTARTMEEMVMEEVMEGWALEGRRD